MEATIQSCDILLQYGTSEDIKAEANSDVQELWGYFNDANKWQKEAGKDKKYVQKLWWRARDAQRKELEFIDWVETFDVSAASSGSECTVRGTRVDHENETNGKHQYDFVIFYMNGDDCDGTEDATITIHKNAKFW